MDDKLSFCKLLFCKIVPSKITIQFVFLPSEDIRN